MLDWLRQEGIHPALIKEAEAFRKSYQTNEQEREEENGNGHQGPARGWAKAQSSCRFHYYGKEIWEEALCAILSEKNLLLAGPKATGKNVLAENLACVFGRPCYTVSFHINVDASYLIGTDTFDGEKVVFRPGPVYCCAKEGGFGVLDEINMAKNEAMAVLHATLDHRRLIEVPGYERIRLHPAARFIGTMNHGYAGTRELNEALGSRFVVIQMPTISEAQLTRLLTEEYPEMNHQMGRQLCAIFYELEAKAESAEISPRAVDLRGLLDAVALMKRGLPPLAAMDMGIANKIFSETERAIAHDVIAARLPKAWN